MIVHPLLVVVVGIIGPCLLVWLLSVGEYHVAEMIKRRGLQDMLCTEKAKRVQDNYAKDCLAERVRALEDAIKKHMHAKGHDRCWLNDLELYRVLDPEFDKMRLELPCLPEFIHNCTVYWRDSQPPEARKLGGV
jgi:hypothetical protein